MKRISWTAHVTNEQRVSEKKLIDKHSQKWIGHVLQHDLLLRGIMKGRISGERPSGRSRQKTLDWMTDKAQWREKLREWCTEPTCGQKSIE